MIKSNISINSNIYIRNDPDIRNDKQYTKKITGKERLIEISKRYIGFEKIPLTHVQEMIISGGQKCSYARDGEMSFGPILVNGELRWVCRCEYDSCSGHNGCYPMVIPRETEVKNESVDKKSLHDFFEKLGIIIQDDTVEFKRDRNTAVIEESVDEFIAPSEQEYVEIKKDSAKYVEITSPDCIIKAPLDSHIILNSGPGTGKTYTIIQRLIFVLANDLCPADEIYILCYTRSAKKVIEDKIDKAVADGVLQPSAKNICILTFDSYATYFLIAMKEQGVIKDDFESSDYNDRIKLFNKHITSNDFEGISYFIVDEIQDLVNERAEMVLNIVKGLDCGYLLAGDRCQSIYDYEADKNATIDSVEFYRRAEEVFPEDMERYEITVNRRQSSELAEQASIMRQVLLNDSFFNQNKYAKDVIANYSGKTKVESYIKSLIEEPTVPTAILCRNNGEAEYISAMLCERGIAHRLNRGVNNNNPLPRWIADIFWDHCTDTISKTDFLDRFRFRCVTSIDPDTVWQLLCKMTGSENAPDLNVKKVIHALTVSSNIPSEFFEDDHMLTVSTIHKAKGSEFDRVILIESQISLSSDSAEEARVRYVALTRPKDQFITMKKNSKYFKRTASGRVIEMGLHNIYKTKNKFCKCITVGLNEDIDNNSFVSGDFDSIVDLQEYIINNIKLYDKLSAKYSRDRRVYELFYKGKCIGALSKKMTYELELGVEATDYRYHIPDSLENLYVSGISTVILKKADNNIPIEYQDSKICFGIQVTGLAKLVFGKK